MVTEHISLSSMPLGLANFSTGNPRVSCAAFINLAHAGKAALLPSCLGPRGTLKSSTPNQQPAAICGVNPTNQASLQP